MSPHNCCNKTFASVCLLAVFTTSRVLAADEGIVTGNGVAVIKRQPEVMRMQVELSAKGKTAEEALAKLKARREAAEKKLLELGAEKKSIVRGEPRIVAANTDRQRQMEMMVAERMRASGKKPAKKTETEPVNISASLSIEWPLNGKTGEELMIATHGLTEKVRAADLAGTKKSATTSAEEEEAAEEAAALADRYNGSNQPSPGEPRFVFLARITPEEESKAMADAFAKAKAQALQLSHAAGAELGPLKSVRGDATPGNSADDYLGMGMDNSEYYYRYMQMQQRVMNMSDDGPQEAANLEPTSVMHAVRISATFALR